MTGADVISALATLPMWKVYMLKMLKTEPVRVYSIVAAAVALAAHFWPALPVVLVLGLAAAVLGLGETVRANVSPSGSDPAP